MLCSFHLKLRWCTGSSACRNFSRPLSGAHTTFVLTVLLKVYIEAPDVARGRKSTLVRFLRVLGKNVFNMTFLVDPRDSFNLGKRVLCHFSSLRNKICHQCPVQKTNQSAYLPPVQFHLNPHECVSSSDPLSCGILCVYDLQVSASLCVTDTLMLSCTPPP